MLSVAYFKLLYQRKNCREVPFKKIIYLILARGEGREKKRESNINMRENHWWVTSPTCPDQGLNWWLCGTMSNQLSHTGQGDRYLWVTLRKGICLNMSEYHRLGGLNNKYLFLTVLETENSKIKVPADSILGQGFLPCSQMTIFLLSLHGAERKGSGVSSFSHKGTNPIRGPTLVSSPKAPHSETMTLGVRASTYLYELGVGGWVFSP